jgi:26S proteasome regulatory subunit N10
MVSCLIVGLFLVEAASSKVNKSFEPHRSALGQTKFRATGILHDKVRAATATYSRAFNIKFAIPQLPSTTTTTYPEPTSSTHTSPQQRHNIKMVLEAVMVVVDNSESSRNGDYTPTRFEAQSDAVSLIFSAITQANPESSVGLMSMGGKGPEVLVTLTTDHGKILEGLHRTKSKIRGGSHLATGIQIAGVCSLFSLPLQILY